MSMLKKLKRIFVVEEEGGRTSDPKPTKKSNKKAVQETPVINIDNSKKASSSKPDEKFVTLLLKAIEENNVEGFDYIEFKQSVQSLKNVEQDEGQRFKNAFAMAESMGLTKNKLFSSAKHYVKVLDTEEKKFAEAFESQKNKQVNDRESRSTQMEASIKEKEAQIQKLQKEIDKEKKQLANVESDITKALAKVEATKDGFYAAYNMVLQQIKDDLDKITTYIS